MTTNGVARNEDFVFKICSYYVSEFSAPEEVIQAAAINKIFFKCIKLLTHLRIEKFRQRLLTVQSLAPHGCFENEIKNSASWLPTPSSYLDNLRLNIRLRRVLERSLLQLVWANATTPMGRRSHSPFNDTMRTRIIFLLSLGADINTQDYEGNTPLMIADGYKCTALASHLRSHGALT